MCFIIGVTTEGKPVDNFTQVYFCVPVRVKYRIELLNHRAVVKLLRQTLTCQ